MTITMTKRLFAIATAAFIALALSVPAFGSGKLQGYAQIGGQTVLTSLTGSSVSSLRLCPGATITPKIGGVGATTYKDSALTQPNGATITANSRAEWAFYAADGEYTLEFTGCSTSWTLAGLRIGTGSVGLPFINPLDAPYSAPSDQVTDASAQINLALTALKAAGGGTLILPTWFVVNSTVNMTLNTASQIGDLAGVDGITIQGVGELASGFIGATGSAPVIDTTGQGHFKLRDFGIREGAANKPAIGILMGRSTLGYSANPQHVVLENLYIDFLTNTNAANNNNGRVGIYNRDGVENVLYVNLEVIADNPLVLTRNNIFSTVGSSLVTAGAPTSLALNSVIGGFFDCTGTLATNASIIMEGVTDPSFRDVIVYKSTAGLGSPTYPFRILADAATPTNRIAKLVIENLHVEQYRAMILLTAPIDGGRIHGSYTQAGGGTAIIYGGANAELNGCELDIINTDTSTVAQAINDAGNAGKMIGCKIRFRKPLTIVMNASTLQGNEYWYNDTTEPTITSAAPDAGKVVHLLNATRFSRRRVPYSTLTLVNGANANVNITGNDSVIVSGPTGAHSISGFQIDGGTPKDGDVLELLDNTGQQLTITNEGVGSTAAFRILTLSGVDTVGHVGGSAYAVFRYSSTVGRWLLTSGNLSATP